MDKHTDCCGFAIRRLKGSTTLGGFAIPHQSNESLVKKYIELCHFSHFFRTFAVLFISFITNNLIYSIIP